MRVHLNKLHEGLHFLAPVFLYILMPFHSPSCTLMFYSYSVSFCNLQTFSIHAIPLHSTLLPNRQILHTFTWLIPILRWGRDLKALLSFSHWLSPPTPDYYALFSCILYFSYINLCSNYLCTCLYSLKNYTLSEDWGHNCFVFWCISMPNKIPHM